MVQLLNGLRVQLSLRETQVHALVKKPKCHIEVLEYGRLYVISELEICGRRTICTES